MLRPVSFSSSPCSLPCKRSRWRGLARRRVGRLTCVAWIVFGASSGGASLQYTVELPEEGLDRKVARRTLALELREVEVQAHPARPEETPEDVSLFIRVRAEGEALLVELWDRGERAGNRRVSAQGHPTVVARRVALKSAELVRQLALDRQRAQLRWGQALREEEEKQRLAGEEELRRRTRLRAELAGHWVPRSLVLFGPQLGLEWNRELPLRLHTDISYQAGCLNQSAPSAVTALTLRVGATGVFSVSRLWDMELGGFVGAQTLQFLRGVEVDRLSGQHSTWSALAGAEWTQVLRWTPHVELRLGLQGGMILRPVLVNTGEQEESIRGGFVGLRAGVALP